MKSFGKSTKNIRKAINLTNRTGPKLATRKKLSKITTMNHENSTAKKNNRLMLKN